MRNVHRTGTLLLSLVMLAIGVALIVEAVTGLGGVGTRLLAGALFMAGGLGRLYVELRRDRPVRIAKGVRRRPARADTPAGNGSGAAGERTVAAPTNGGRPQPARGRRRRRR